MQFFKISALLLPVLAGMNVVAAPAPAPEPAALPQPWHEEAAPGQETYPAPTTVPTLQPLASRDIGKRGFGCPGNPYECSEHCRSLGGGRSGGYCGGPWWLLHPTCICVFK
ncbi:hypothetical protein NA56DRAFT_644363 [Hyaloscypha hepaticicola]|uniref:Invertebrate defensins family profile domain-containing protein n=1 Tax=Hyaloscypha hepaticicola TaxID=2082293 RepID=A0A2J6Q911_9HELO|nr:hypothetical protein NA56DRAFT_644363 [Hyaloscypha hepaticicola]